MIVPRMPEGEWWELADASRGNRCYYYSELSSLEPGPELTMAIRHDDRQDAVVTPSGKRFRHTLGSDPGVLRYHALRSCD